MSGELRRLTHMEKHCEPYTRLGDAASDAEGIGIGVEKCTNREDLIGSTPALEIDYFAEARTLY